MVWLKRVFYLLLILFGLLGAALAYLGLFVNPNDFKDELKSLALEKANIHLRLDGDIRWSFFPWLGLQLEDIGVALGGQAEVVEFGRAEFGLAILPLFERRIQVDKVNLMNLKANLVKNTQGQGNWQFNLPETQVSQMTSAQVTEKGAKANNTTEITSVQNTSTSDTQFTIPDIQLDELRIENAQVSYRDEQSQQWIQAQLDVQLQDVQWHKAWPMQLQVKVTQSDLSGAQTLQLEADVKSLLTVFPERESMQFEGIQVNATVASENLLSSPLEAKLSAAKVSLDLPQENVLVEGLALSALGLDMDAKIDAYQVMSAPQFTASLALHRFNPRLLLKKLDLAVPEMADETAFTSVKADLALEGSLDNITAQPISIQLDDTNMEANAVLSLSPLRWDIKLAGANLDLDRYLPPPSEEEAVKLEQNIASTEQKANSESSSNHVTSAAQQFTPAELIPVELIRSLNGHLGLVFDNIKVSNLSIDKLVLDSTQHRGLVKVAPLQASLYQGKVSALLTLDARGAVPSMDIQPAIDGVQIQPLLKDFMDMDKLAGATYLNGELMSQGKSLDALMSSLQGDLLVEIKQGALVGTNLTKTVCEGIAATRKEKINGTQFGEDTPFETLRFPANVQQGKVSTPGLAIRSAGLQVTGDGVISLPNRMLDYQANVGIAGSQLDDACRVNETLSQLTFPIVCKGQFNDAPASLCRPDLKGFGQLFAKLAKQEAAKKLAVEKAKLAAQLKQKKAELKSELAAQRKAEEARLKAELEAKRKAEEERLKKKVKEKLKNLF
ncbi:AsmA family protein [Marinomonas sp. THO17]|uniref:AsmA family protein n=1 Tax=Marinomonas sp. THO17 TaxID=3149048 RepID=UPI00336BCD9F